MPPATRYAPPTTIVVLNNNGGGIFRRLPIAEFEPPFTDLFLTPHDLDFEHAARLYDLAFVRVTNQAEFRQALGESMYNPVPTLIEVVTNGRSDHEHRQEPNKNGKQPNINSQCSKSINANLHTINNLRH